MRLSLANSTMQYWPKCAYEPFTLRVGSYALLWVVFVAMSLVGFYWMFVFYVFIGVLTIFTHSVALHLLSVFWGRANRDKLVEIFTTGPVNTDDSSLVLPRCANPSIGEEVLLVPRTGKIVGAYVFALIVILTLCISVLALVDASFMPDYFLPMIIVLSLDVLFTWVWYCTSFADTFALNSVSLAGFKGRFSLWGKIELVEWDRVDLHVCKIGLSMDRVVFVCPLGIKTFLLHEEDVASIMAMMSCGD